MAYLEWHRENVSNGRKYMIAAIVKGSRMYFRKMRTKESAFWASHPSNASKFSYGAAFGRARNLQRLKFTVEILEV